MYTRNIRNFQNISEAKGRYLADMYIQLMLSETFDSKIVTISERGDFSSAHDKPESEKNLFASLRTDTVFLKNFPKISNHPV